MKEHLTKPDVLSYATVPPPRRVATKRCLAAMIDIALLSPILLIALILPSDPTGRLAERIGWIAPLYAAVVIYSETLFGRSLGKKVMDLRITSAVGPLSPADFGRSRGSGEASAGQLFIRTVVKAAVLNFWVVVFILVHVDLSKFRTVVNPMVFALFLLSLGATVHVLQLHWLYQMVRDPSRSVHDWAAGTAVVAEEKNAE